MTYQGTSRGVPARSNEGMAQPSYGSTSYGGTRYGGTSTRNFLDDLNHAVTANPVAAGLLGAGVLWMLFGSKRIGQIGHLGNDAVRTAASTTGNAIGAAGSAASRAGQMMASGMSTASSQVASAAGQLVGGVGEVAGRIGDAARQAGQSVASGAQSAMESLSEAASSGVKQASSAFEAMTPAADATRDAANSGMQSAEGMATDGVRAAQEFGDNFRQSITRAIDSQPLLVGAIGFAVGAGIAATFHSTSFENRLMGESGEAVREQMGALASRAKEMATSRASEVMDELKDQGLNLSNPTETLKSMANKVSEVASSVGDSTKARLS